MKYTRTRLNLKFTSFFVSKNVMACGKRGLPKFIALPELSDGILIAVSLVALIRVVFSPINFTEVSWSTSKTEIVCQSLVYFFFRITKTTDEIIKSVLSSFYLRTKIIAVCIHIEHRSSSRNLVVVTSNLPSIHAWTDYPVNAANRPRWGRRNASPQIVCPIKPPVRLVRFSSHGWMDGWMDFRGFMPPTRN